MKKIFAFVLLACLGTGWGFSQSIQLIMSPRPSCYFSDWQNKTETIRLIVNNPTKAPIDCKLKTQLFNSKEEMVGETDVNKMPVLTLQPGISQFVAEDIYPLDAIKLFGNSLASMLKTGKIPEDNYRLCTDLLDPLKGTPLTPAPQCKMFTIVDYQAPVLLFPRDGDSIPEARIREVNFRWSPVTPSANQMVIYRLQIWKVLEGQTKVDACRNNIPVYEKDFPGVLQTEWPFDFVPEDDQRTFVWSVTPFNDQGRNLVTEGYGMAEPFGFSISISGNATDTNAIQVKLSQPPLNQLTLEDLNIQLNNDSKEPIDVSLRGTITLTSNADTPTKAEVKPFTFGLGVRFILKPFTLPPGTTTFTYDDIKKGDIKFESDEWAKAFGPGGVIPSGDYEICASVLDKSGKEIGKDCIEQKIAVRESPTIKVAYSWETDYHLENADILGYLQTDEVIIKKGKYLFDYSTNPNGDVTLPLTKPIRDNRINKAEVMFEGIPADHNCGTDGRECVGGPPSVVNGKPSYYTVKPVLANGFIIQLILSYKGGNSGQNDNGGTSAVTVKLNPPAPNQLKLTDLTNFTLTNGILKPLEVVLSCTLTSAKPKPLVVIIIIILKKITLPPGPTTFTYDDFKSGDVKFASDEWSKVFGPNGKEPAGDYTLCVSVLDNSGKEIGKGCIEQKIIGSDAPQLISPTDDLPPTSKRPTFEWKMEAALENVSYSITVKELEEGNDIENGVMVLERSNIRETTLPYPQNTPSLDPVKSYGWQLSWFKNGRLVGRTPFTRFCFTKGTGGDAPLRCDCGNWSPIDINNVRHDCGGRIDWKCNDLINFSGAYQCRPNDGRCQAKTSWEISKDGAVLNSGSGSAGSFNPTSNGTYILTINALCNGTKCSPCTTTFIVEGCVTCDCGNWSPIDINNVRHDCGGRIDWHCNELINFSGAYQCRPNDARCQAKTSWEISKDGAVLNSGSGSAGSFTPTANGTYTLTLHANCNGNECKDCVTTFIVEDCLSCDCGEWIDFPITIQSSGVINSRIKCDGSVTLGIGTYSIQYPNYKCTPDNDSCLASYLWSVHLLGTTVSQGYGSGNLINFNFSQTGTYLVSITPTCGRYCDPCMIEIKIEDPLPCNLSFVDNLKDDYCVGDQVTINWTGSTNPSTVNLVLIDFTNWTAFQIIASSIPNSGTYTWTLPANLPCDPERKWCIYGTDPAISPQCWNYSKEFTIGCCNTCDCGSWSTLLVNEEKYECGGEKPIKWTCNKPIKFSNTYRCSPNDARCQAKTSWEVSKDGAVLNSGSGSAGSFTPTSNGTYILTINALCNGTKCSPCITTFIVEDCLTCDCGTWGPIDLNKMRYDCGGRLEWECKQPFRFTAFYQCNPSDENCSVQTSWELKKEGVTIQTGLGANRLDGSFSLIIPGIYTLTLNASCNRKKCNSCSFLIIALEEGVILSDEPKTNTDSKDSSECKNFVVELKKIYKGDSIAYQCLINNKYSGTEPAFKPKSFNIKITNDSILSIADKSEKKWKRTPSKFPPGSTEVKWTTTSGDIPGGKSNLGTLYFGEPTVNPLYVIYEWLNNEGKVICKDSIALIETRFYYDLAKEPSNPYTEISNGILRVQWFNRYASVENIQLSIYDVESKTLLKPGKAFKFNSVAGLNRISINTKDYNLEPGRNYLMNVSDFKSNNYLNFKVTNDREK